MRARVLARANGIGAREFCSGEKKLKYAEALVSAFLDCRHALDERFVFRGKIVDLRDIKLTVGLGRVENPAEECSLPVGPILIST